MSESIPMTIYAGLSRVQEIKVFIP